jgi:hypothetical protein
MAPSDASAATPGAEANAEPADTSHRANDPEVHTETAHPISPMRAAQSGVAVRIQ